VNRVVGEAEKFLEEGNIDEAGPLLYQAKLGGPKTRRFLKVMQESGTKQLVQKIELEHLADRKLPLSRQRFRDIEDRLLFVLDEKGHSVHLTDRGVEFLSPSEPDAFVLPDISERVHRIDHDPDLAPQEKLDARAEVEREYAAKAEKLNIIHQLLRAHSLYEKDVNYVVQDGQVLIVDEFTGRTMPGRRWAEGLHQAVEAKEGVQVKGETQTLATITIQNYFRMYDKLAGMTGTAETEETEFFQIYGLEVAVIPTNRPIIREDRQDLIYKTRREKYNAILEEAERLNKLSLPVLIGTTSVESSETLARMFKLRGMKPEVLNAKYHQREAEIIALAGQPGGVTIATNMAGRGTDIKLGPGVTDSQRSVISDEKGNEEEVTECGGLHIIGSERHESRRIDRQLRGRAGRQGDPGASQFFLSLEDDLMRLFGSERIARLMDRLGAQDGEVLTHPMITRSIENAQKRVEMQNFQIRKRLLDYDDVMNQQREVIYSLRSFALEGGEELKGEAIKMVEKAIERRVEKSLSQYESSEDWDLPLLKQELLMHFLLTVPALESDDAPSDMDDVTESAVAAGLEAFQRKFTSLGEFSDRLLALVMLNVIDEKWKDHLYDLDQLRGAINYRAWGQKDPLMEYKQEAYSMFVDLIADINNTFAERFLRVQVVFEQRPQVTQTAPAGAGAAKYDAFGISAKAAERGTAAAEGMGPATTAIGPSDTPATGAASKQEPTVISGGKSQSLSGMAAQGGGGMFGGEGKPPKDWSSVGRNDPCPCGSGKKFKKCHGASS
jgi:preprotein translocase subunit SecA